MRKRKIIIATLAVAALLTASVSSADAGWYRHRGPGPVLGLLGGIVVGAATIATLPLAIVAGAARPGPGYYGRNAYYYGPPPQSWGDGYGYNYGDGGNYGPPPPPRYYRNYGPPPGYYGGYRNGY